MSADPVPVAGGPVPEQRFSDGLSKPERWRRAVDEPETLLIVVQRVADGETLRQVCNSRGWPYGKVLEWLVDEEERCGKYRRAKQLGAEAEVDHAKEIALGSGDAKLQVDTLFRRAKHHAPDMYGERVKVDRSVTLTADAGLLGFASELLGKVRDLPRLAAVERAVEGVVISTDAEV